MRKLFALVMLPFSVHAQETPNIKETRLAKTELIVNSGIALRVDHPYTQHYPTVDLLRHGVGAYRRFGNYQVGCVVDFAIDNTGDIGNKEIAPQLLFNGTFTVGKHYAYGGGAVGFNYMDHGALYPGATSKGYLLGLQAGFVLNVSKRFAVSLDAGLRSAQMWQTSPGLFEQSIDKYFILYFPVTAGVRYKF